MFRRSARSAISLLLEAALIVGAMVPARAQGVTPVPRTDSSQKDAKRPPSVEGPAPQAPPGTTPLPQVTPAPVAPSPETAPLGVTPDVEGARPASGQESTPSTVNIPPARPLPPLPSMARLGVSSDNTLALSLNEAVRRAMENNSEIEVARDEVRFAETGLRALEGVYDPIFQTTPQISNRITPVASTLGGSGSSGTVKTTDINFDASAAKLFRTGGGRYELFFNNTRESTSSTFSQLNPFYSSNLGVQFTQPLLRNRAIDANRRAIRIQRRQLAQTDADFRRRVTEIIAEVQRAYWDLVFALRDRQNRLVSLNLVRELFRQTEQRIAIGAVAPVERVEVQTELSSRESDLLVATQNVSLAENNLKRLMLRDPLAPEWSAQLVPTDEPDFSEAPLLLGEALTEARANRPELTRFRLQQEISDIDIQYFRNQRRPRVDVEATVSTTGLAGSPVVPTGSITGGQTSTGATGGGPTPLITGDPGSSANAFLLGQINELRARQGLPPATVPTVTPQTIADRVPANLVGGYGRTLRNIFSLNTSNVVVGVRIEVPFRNRRAEAELAGARIRRSQIDAQARTQEQSIETEVRNAAQAVETARQRVIAAREARASAETQLQAEQRYYEVGRSTTFLLFQRERQLSSARNIQVRAETDYNKALADLQRATSTTLRAYNVTVEPPAAGR